MICASDVLMIKNAFPKMENLTGRGCRDNFVNIPFFFFRLAPADNIIVYRFKLNNSYIMCRYIIILI